MKTIIGIICTILTLPALAQEQQSSPAITPINLRTQGTLYIIDGIVPVKPVQPPSFNFSAPTSYVLTREDIERMPYTNINDMISLFPGVYQSQRGGSVSIYGSRLR